MHLLALPMHAILALEERLVKKRGQIVCMLVGAQDNVAAAPTIAAIGTTAGHKFLPPKTHASAAPVAGFCVHFDPIDKHRVTIHRVPHNDSGRPRHTSSRAKSRDPAALPSR